MLGDKAYDSAELREDLQERGTKPIIPNRCNRKQKLPGLCLPRRCSCMVDLMNLDPSLAESESHSLGL
jgi:hypothetical protein